MSLPDEMLVDGRRRWTRTPGVGFLDRSTGTEIKWLGQPQRCWIIIIDGKQYSDPSWGDYRMKPPFKSAEEWTSLLFGKFNYRETTT